MYGWNAICGEDIEVPVKAKRAGIIRNTEMLQYAMEEIPMVVAFWNGKSHGTKDTIDKAEKAEIECRIVYYGERESLMSSYKEKNKCHRKNQGHSEDDFMNNSVTGNVDPDAAAFATAFGNFLCDFINETGEFDEDEKLYYTPGKYDDEE